MMQLTTSENLNSLRRIDSNRKSRNFSKQPSTGDYYRALGSNTVNRRGSDAMAPSEEVGGALSSLVPLLFLAQMQRRLHLHTYNSSIPLCSCYLAHLCLISRCHYCRAKCLKGDCRVCGR